MKEKEPKITDLKKENKKRWIDMGAEAANNMEKNAANDPLIKALQKILRKEKPKK